MNYACAETYTNTHINSSTHTCWWFIMHQRTAQVDRQQENKLAKRRQTKNAYTQYQK